MGEAGDGDAVYRGESSLGPGFISSFAHHSALLLARQLGALRFDKDVRTISSWLGTHTESAAGGRGGGVVRDKFARLQQMSYVLNLDDDEAETPADEGAARDLYEEAAAAGMAWRLSAEEVSSVRELRVRA